MPEPVALPSSFGRRVRPAAAMVVGILVLLVVGWALGRPATYLGFVGVLGVGAIVVVVRAGVLRRQPTLLLDDEGIKDRTGRRLIAWADAGLIWVGDRSLLGRSGSGGPGIAVWTAQSLDFARRTGFVADLLFSRALETTLGLREVVELIRRFTSAPVHTGRAKDLRRLLAEVRSGELRP